MVTRPESSANEPRWLAVARGLIGLREVPGPKHNSTIIGWLVRAKAWWRNDEVPWCGTFVQHCIREAGLVPVTHWYRARAWAMWGKPCTPCVGAVAVFSREGGGHVGFLVGITRDGEWFLVLGGNQKNSVRIDPIAKSRLLATRWPSAGQPIGELLPIMPRTAVSENEA